ncbi:MAG: hypothetical protein ACLP1X_01710 [Polyangiaceae bacterium]|jgi:hypothetical protein
MVRPIVALFSLVFLGACATNPVGPAGATEGGTIGDGGDGSTSADGGYATLDATPDGLAVADGGAFVFAAPIPLGQNDQCLPELLPANASGGTTCAVILEGLSGDCAAAGLSPATSQEIEVLGKGGPLPAGATCALNQIAGLPDVGCSDQQETGWCYVLGSCSAEAGTCKAALCTSSAFNAAYVSMSHGDAGLQWTATLACP